MKKPINQYLTEQYGGNVSTMAHDWKIAESSIRRMLTATKPVHVYKDDNGRMTIESELKALASA